MRRLPIVAAVVGLAYGLRRRLVHLLTRLTGTWVGTPK